MLLGTLRLRPWRAYAQGERISRCSGRTDFGDIQAHRQIWNTLRVALAFATPRHAPTSGKARYQPHTRGIRHALRSFCRRRLAGGRCQSRLCRYDRHAVCQSGALREVCRRARGTIQHVGLVQVAGAGAPYYWRVWTKVNEVCAAGRDCAALQSSEKTPRSLRSRRRCQSGQPSHGLCELRQPALPRSCNICSLDYKSMLKDGEGGAPPATK